MPDSYGKRQRDAVKARKAAAREERRIARRQRRDGESVASEGGVWEGTPAEENTDEVANEVAEVDQVTPVDPPQPEDVVDLREPATPQQYKQPVQIEKEGR
jgi:hypothetical protein